MDVWVILFVVAVLFIRNRIKSAIIQTRREEVIREAVRKVKQRHRIDELYGRSNNQ